MSIPLLRNSGEAYDIVADQKHFGERPFFEPILAKKKISKWPALQKDRKKPKYTGFEPQLAALIDEAAKLGATIVLTFSPFFPGADEDLILEPTSKIAIEKGVPFIVFNTDLIPEIGRQEYFEDYMHLNGEGAHIFTRKVADLLRPNP